MCFLIGQSENITNWLTPIWLLSVGITIGFLLSIAIWGLLLLLSRVGGLNTLYDKPGSRRAAGLVLSAICFALLFAFSWFRGYWSPADMEPQEWTRHLILMILFYVPGSLLLGFGLVAAISRKRSNEIKIAPRDGLLYWVSVVCIVFVVYAVVGYALAAFDGFGVIEFVDQPVANEFIDSMAQLPVSGERRVTIQLPQDTPEGGFPVDSVAFDGELMRVLWVKTDQPIDVSAVPITEELSIKNYLEFLPDTEKYQAYIKRVANDPRFPNDQVERLYMVNRGNGPATVTVRWLIDALHPQIKIVPWAAGMIVVIYLAYFLFVAAMPKVYAVAQSTFKTEVSQPVFIILALIGVVFAVASIYIPYNTFGEDIKMYKDSGLTLIRVLGIFLAVWAASKSVAEEIEGRTALTVLSKPVSRRQFILGKYVGISMAIGLLFIVVGLWFVFWTAYKPIYDSGESTIRDYSWQNCYSEAVSAIPGLILAYLEALIFAAISIVISTRMGILANFMICFSVYVLGHLTPLIVQSNEVVQAFEGVTTFGYVISAVLPVLDHFDIHAAITGDVAVPVDYLGWSLVYTFLYGFIALLVALVLFEDRDLA